ncbi:hypothetical protein [Lacticigenium naphthae]|uniref:hypothetical protein n=1 Tax=Lacticigenium naphthae TaxID=515351 RepID=UPI0004858FE1|nr:hypothetical protein [Lacticigenium naphthae]
MKNIVGGYRIMTGLTQKEMADHLSISETTYRNKEKKRIPFKDYEMELILEKVREYRPDTEIKDIFFN